MGQKFFISFNSADQTRAHWIAWTLKEAGHEVAVHDWEIPAGGNAPLWMNTKLAWADRLIAVISPDYLPARYSPVEWASEIWNDPDGTKGAVIPVIVRPTPRVPPLLNDLSRIDLTNCSEAEAKSRLLKGVDMPAPPELKPAFEQIVVEAPDTQNAGPVKKPTFIRGNVEDGLPHSLTPESTTAPESKGWMQRWTGKIAALTALLVAAVALMEAAAAFVNKTPSLTCSLGVSLPWCSASIESAKTCDLMARITWHTEREKPLFLSLIVGGREDRFPVEGGNPVAFQVPSGHLSSFSIELVWSDNSRSDFEKFSGCSTPVSRASRDDRAKIDLTAR